MTKIKNYALDLEVRGNDKWIGTDSGSLAKLTKNFTPDNLAKYYNDKEVVESVNQMRFFYDTVDPGDNRARGSFSFPTELGSEVPFSDISDLVFSRFTLGDDAVNNFMTDIVNSIIIIQKADNPDTYAFYALNGYEVNPTDSNFYNVELSFESGNGSVQEDNDYFVSLVQFAGAAGVQTILGSEFIDSTLTGVGEVTLSLSATGTPDDTTYLRGDNTWASIPPGLAGSGTTNYVAKWSAADTLTDSVIYDNGTNVGIGTTSPSAKLDIIGANSNSEAIELYGDSSYGATIGYSRGGSYNWRAGVGGSGSTSGIPSSSWGIEDSAVGSPRLVIAHTSGNVGIGTTSPTEKLDVVGKIALNDGGNSVFIGEGAGLNDDGTNNLNVGVGYRALYSNTTGNFNVANGNAAMQSNITGVNNVGVGFYSLERSTGGSRNVAVGTYAIGLTQGNDNLAIGYAAGYNRVGGTNAGSSGSIYIGSLTYANGINSVNEIVIGTNAISGGSNTVVLGNDSIVTTQLKGNVGIGTTAPSQKLHVSGNARVTGAYYDSNNSAGTSGQVLSSTATGTDWVSLSEISGVQTVVSSATVTPTASDDLVVITAQAAGLTLDNPTGTFVQGQSMVIRIKDNGTARSIAYGVDYRAIGVTLPTTTVINKTTYLGCIYNATDSKLDVVGVCTEA